jgi:uncharacterized coiled-coil protein SlyX
MSENDERLTNLELKFMEQAQLVEELSDELAVCHRRIDELARENKSLHEMVSNLEPESEASPDE